MIIGFMGKKECGKSYAAKYLEHTHNYDRIAFADPIKNMLSVLGLDHEALWGKTKEHPSPLLCGRTARHAMQTLGTEWGRNLIHPDLWVRSWLTLVEPVREDTCVVVEDVRFKNEVDMIKRLKGVVILIDNPFGSNPQPAEHISERWDPSWADTSIINDFTPAFNEKLDALL